MLARDVRVVVTGLGMITPLGIGQRELWQGVLDGRSTARLVSGMSPEAYPTSIACQVDDERFDPTEFVKNRKSLKLMGRAVKFAVAAAHLAVRDAGLDLERLDPTRCGVALGAGGVGLNDGEHLAALLQISRELTAAAAETNVLALAQRYLNPLTPLKILPNIAAAHIAIEHGLRGENVTVCTACTSGTQAIGEALRLMRLGHADVMLAGASDAMINATGLIGFGLLGVLSRRNDDPARASRPFDRDRDGFVMGEGAAVLVLETLGHAKWRDAPILAELIGYGGCSDAYRITDERDDGGGCIDAMRLALADARVPPAAIQYINAHGTGTQQNDRTEALSIKRVFGEHSRRLCISSTKSQIGHLVAAAGAVELAVCVLALRHQVAPPTINHETPDPECDLDIVPNEARPMALETILSNSFGFGGQNACLVVRRWDGS